MRKRSKWLALVMILMALGMGTALFLQPWQKKAPGGLNAGGIVLDSDAEDWDSPVEAPPAENGIRIPGYGTIYFPTGERTVSLTLYNPKENRCCFAFSLYLEGEETPLYQSDYVEPGKAIRSVTLSRGLEAGEYTIYISIQTYDPETQAQKNGASVKAALVVS